MHDGEDDRLAGPLGRAADELRREPPLRSEWRAELLHRVQDVAQEPPRQIAPHTTWRRWSISIPWAIAAGVACALVGAAAARLAPSRQPVTPQQIAAAVLPVKFSVVAPNAARVSIVGDFNQWNPTALPMKRSADGRLWEVEVRLPLGRYSYAFMIDGHLSPDPAAPSSAGDDFGTPNSVLMVRGS
jgi:hypothetical protein